MFDCATAIYYDADGGVVLDNASAIETDLLAEGIAASGNLIEDPNFVDAAAGDYNLSGSSLCSIARGGLDGETLAWGFSDDIEGSARSANWSMGAYEYDGACQ